MKAIVTGMIGTYPLGGVAWDYGQYAAGLEQLGFDVVYLEDTALPSSVFNPDTGAFEANDREAAAFVQRSRGAGGPSCSLWTFSAFGVFKCPHFGFLPSSRSSVSSQFSCKKRSNGKSAPEPT